ncbi:DNA-processing protein DprA [Antribacter gilvus]|uniref:DNA-processing protein DprA n=1 Tax=Antribacter gilvus TaxID=2304675 RepID=UPI000F76B97B|nr:DNA-processing protein DprA [Antribacter gilvus]
MMPQTHEHAALFALLRRGGEPWARIAAGVAFEGSAMAIWNASQADEALFDLPGSDSGLEAASAEISAWEARRLSFTTVLDSTYPRRLLDVHETPPFLFYEGDLRSVDDGMSVVGSRSASVEGQRLAADVARFLVEEGLTVISGLAAGIDAAAHRAALEAGGRTVAFIGTGIARSYPAANAGLQREIAERGLVLSQFLPDAPPSKQSFPMRNASMSGYGLATIVIEAGEHSGTRNQVRRAGDHGRPVILTERVASSTSWGSALRGSPGVHVVGSMSDLGHAVSEIRERPRLAEEALAALAGA